MQKVVTLDCMNRALRILHFRARQIFFGPRREPVIHRLLGPGLYSIRPKIAEISKRVQMVGKFFGINRTFLMRPIQPKIRAILGRKSNGTEISGQKFSIILAFVAGSIVGAREIKFWQYQSHSPLSPRRTSRLRRSLFGSAAKTLGTFRLDYECEFRISNQ